MSGQCKHCGYDGCVCDDEEIQGHFRARFRTVEDGVNNENLIDKFLMGADGNTVMNPEWVDAPFEEVYYPADLYESSQPTLP